MVAKEKKTGKETTHTYTYNAYGDVETQDGTRFTYGDVSGQVTSETTKLTKNKDVVKSYTYDSADNKSTFDVTVGGKRNFPSAMPMMGNPNWPPLPMKRAIG